MLAADVVDDLASTRDRRRRFATACIAGGAPAFAVFGWFLTAARADLLQASAFGNFYDLQARALLRGRWDLPARSLLFEGILRNGKTYEYYGPVPALLRIPILLVTHRLDGRLTQVSMLIAYAVGLIGASWLLWLVRLVVRPGAPLDRREWWVVSAWTFAIGCGSVLLFPASLPIVYHEAVLWGTAFTLVAFAAVIRFAVRPSPPRLVVAGALATLAILSRASVGLGPTAALGFVGLGMLMIRSWTGVGLRSRVRAVLPVMIATIVPLAGYMLVNLAKFATPASTPFDHQIFSAMNAHRRSVLLANGGSLFNLRYFATTVVQYLRPDALRVWHLFPFLDFTTWRAPVFLGASFDELDRSASVTATMPGLVVLAATAAVAALRRRLRGTGMLALAAAVLGALVAVLPTLTIGFIANRYLLDFLPLLVIPACVGLQLLLSGTGPAGFRRRLLAAVVAVLLAFGVWANLATIVTYGRLYAPADGAVRRGFIGLQEDIGKALGTGGYRIIRPSALGRPEPDTLANIGRCSALYWASGSDIWNVVELGARGIHLRLRLNAQSVDTPPKALVTVGPGTYTVTIRSTQSSRWQIGVSSRGAPAQSGVSFRRPDKTSVAVVVWLDRELGSAAVAIDGREEFSAGAQEIPRLGAVHVGASVESLPVKTPLCERLPR